MFHVKRKLDEIRVYCDLLAKWNEKINLVGRTSMDEVMTRHVQDCLQLSSYLPDKNFDIADLGTGAGLPGVILALEGFTKLTLIDSDQKKCVFLREVRRVLGLEYRIINSRIENLNQKFDVIVSRALASLTDLFSLSLPLMKDSSKCLFLKGMNYEEEIREANRFWHYNFLVHPSKTGCGGVVLEVQNIRKQQ